MARKARTEKVSVMPPSELLEEVRSTVQQGEVSSFLAEALEHYMVYHRQKAAIEKAYGAWDDIGHPDLNTPEDSSRYVAMLREKERVGRGDEVDR